MQGIDMPAEAIFMLTDLPVAIVARSCRWLLTLSLLWCVGCRQEPATVSGLVTLDGQPLAIRQAMRGTVVFHPASGEGAILSGLIDARGKYKLAMGANSEVAPGGYLVTVSAVEVVPPTKDQQEPSGRHITPAKYASAVDSGLRCEIVPGPNHVDLKLTSEVESSPVPAPPDSSPSDQVENDNQLEETPGEAQ